jgi:hypothetical protein
MGDFLHCLPVISGFCKKFGVRVSFGISQHLRKFDGIRELLLLQGFFSEVYFLDEHAPYEDSLLLHNLGKAGSDGKSPMACYQFLNHLKGYGLDFDIDCDFELKVPILPIDYLPGKIIVGDRWSPSDAPDVDSRRLSNVLRNSGKFNGDRFHYLDYRNGVVHNASLIKYNPNPFYTTSTGISIVSDMMNKESYMLYGPDMENWQGNSIECEYDFHYFKNKRTRIASIGSFSWDVDFKTLSRNPGTACGCRY